MNNKCVYVHKLNGEVVYVGSGNKTRVIGKAGRSDKHLTVWKDLQFEIVSENLSVDESIELEQELLNQFWPYGRLFNKQKNVYAVKQINFEELNKFLQYDETSPTCLRWKVGIAKKIKSGDIAGSTEQTDGYSRIRLNGKFYTVHRVVLVLHTEQDIQDGFIVDHIDGNKQNNKISNLRITSQSENNKNRVHPRSNTGFQSISEETSCKRFCVNFRDNTRHQIYFTYTSKPIKTTKNHYPTRELALEAALLVRDMLVDSGKIILTNKEEL